MSELAETLSRLKELQRESAARWAQARQERATRGAELDRKLAELKELVAQRERDTVTQTIRLRVNKRTQRIRFEHETEESVEVVIEPKEEQG